MLWESIGFEPFEVSLDASSSRLNDTNDQITYFSWDFWDGQAPLECEGRTCTEMIKSWSEKGSYLIKVKMDFEDQQSVEQTMEFRIRG